MADNALIGSTYTSVIVSINKNFGDDCRMYFMFNATIDDVSLKLNSQKDSQSTVILVSELKGILII